MHEVISQRDRAEPGANLPSPIISEALRIRLHPTTPSEYADLAERHCEVVTFIDMVINTTLHAGEI